MGSGARPLTRPGRPGRSRPDVAHRETPPSPRHRAAALRENPGRCPSTPGSWTWPPPFRSPSTSNERASSLRGRIEPTVGSPKCHCHANQPIWTPGRTRGDTYTITPMPPPGSLGVGARSNVAGPHDGIAATPSFLRTGPEAVAHQQAGLSALDRVGAITRFELSVDASSGGDHGPRHTHRRTFSTSRAMTSGR
jgi:hypothetical protein